MPLLSATDLSNLQTVAQGAMPETADIYVPTRGRGAQGGATLAYPGTPTLSAQPCRVGPIRSPREVKVADKVTSEGDWDIAFAAGTGALVPKARINITSLLGPGNENPTIAAPSATAVAGSGLGTGTYKYQVTFLTAVGETAGSAEVSVTTTTGNQQVNLTAMPTGPTTGPYLITARKIYRTAVGGASGTEKLLTTINDNTTTTYSDTTADGSLGAAVPTSNTSGLSNRKFEVLAVRSASFEVERVVRCVEVI